MDKTSSPHLQKKIRLHTLNKLGLLSTSTIVGLDRLTELVSTLVGAPVSLITIVNDDRQFFKSLFGLPEPAASQRETPSSYSICQHVVTSKSPWIVEDTRQEVALKESFTPSALNIIAYLGVPLVTAEGTCIGSFCVIDVKPRKWTAGEVNIVEKLALSVMTEIELHAQTKATFKSETLLKATLAHAPLILYRLDQNGRITLIEGNGLQAANRKANELIGLSIYDLYGGSQTAVEHLNQAYQGISARATVTVQGRTYDTWYEPVVDEANQVVAVVGVAHDITLAQTTQAVLEKSALELGTLNDISLTLSDYSDLQEALNTLMQRISLLFDGQVTALSIFTIANNEQRVAAVYDQFNMADFVVDLVFPLSIDTPAGNLYTLLQKKRCLFFDDLTIFPLPDGVVPLIEMRQVKSLFVIPLFAHRELIGSIVIVRTESINTLTESDISLAETIGGQIAASVQNAHLFSSLQTELNERKAIEERLRTSLIYEEMLAKCARALQSTEEEQKNLSDSIYYLLEGTGVDRVFLGHHVSAPNNQWFIQWDYEYCSFDTPSIDSALRKRPYYVPADWHEAVQQSQGMFIPGGEHLGEYHTYFSEKSADYSCYMLPIGQEGNWIGMLGLVKSADETFWSNELIRVLQTAAQMIYTFLERQQSDQALKAAHREALVANQFKDQILAKVSHELKTPLSAILGYSELLQQEAYGSITDKQGEVLSEIVESTDYLNMLVNEFLQQARLDSNKSLLDLSYFELEDFFSAIQKHMYVLAESKDLHFDVDISSNLPKAIQNDRSRLQQILLNLLNNAIKFTDTGFISLIAKPAPDGYWEIQVRDSGVGIPAEAQSLVFDPFWQVDGSISRRVGGTGLGLSITKQVIELMGGTIQLKSALGAGSTFTITLPLTVGKIK